MKHKVVRLVIAGVMAIIAGGAPVLSASAAAIQFDLNGVAPVVHTESSSGSAKVPTIELDFTNMTFTGWNTSPTGNGQTYRAGDTINTDTTLYAQWADGTHIGGGGSVDPDPDPDPDPDEDYATLSDLSVVTVTVDGKLLSSFNPLTNGTYTVPSGSVITLHTNTLDLDLWEYDTDQPSSNTLTFTMTGKGKNGNITVTYTFKAEAKDPDPDPDPDPSEEHAKLSDLNSVTATVNGQPLQDFIPTQNGTYNLPVNPDLVLDTSKLDPAYWDVTVAQVNNTRIYTLTGQATNNETIIITYTFIAAAELPDPNPDPDNPGTITGDVDNNNNNGNGNNNGNNNANGSSTNNTNNTNGTTGNNSTNTSLHPGSPTAGFISIANIKTAAPLAAIASGTLAVLAVLLLTNKEAKQSKKQAKRQSRKQASNGTSNKATHANHLAFLSTITTHKTYLPIMAISTLAILAGSFYLINTNTQAATDSEDWGIYVDDEGVPYEGYVTLVPSNGQEVNKVTTWWKGGVQQSGETFRNNVWSFFDPTDGNRMARGRDVFLPTTDIPDRWVRYDDYGAMVKGETVKDDNWYYFDEQTGAMAKGLTTLPSGKTVYYDKITGVMMKGWWNADGHTWHSDTITGQIHPFYEDGRGAGALQSGQAIAELAVRLAPTADGYSSPIFVSNAWTKVSNPEAQEYIRTMELVTEPYTDNYTANPALASCTQAAGHVIRATVDPDAYIQDTAIFRNYLDSSGRWEYLGNLGANESLDSGRLQPGDILTTENNVHTIIYVGNELVRQAYPNSTANTFEADYSTGQYPHLATHTTYPRANGDTFRIYRYKGKSGATDHPYVDIWRYLGGDPNYNLGYN